MHIFITGATGWVGSAVVKDLLEAGHEVTGLVRSPQSATASELSRLGMHLAVGTLDDLELLRDCAAHADATVHTAFNHDFSKYSENAEQDRLAIEALGEGLSGSERP